MFYTPSTILFRKNRRGLNQEKLKILLEHFEHFYTAEQFVTDLKQRKNATSTKLPLAPIPSDLLLPNTASLEGQASSQ